MLKRIAFLTALLASPALAQETVSSPVQQQLVKQVQVRLGELEISNMQLQDQLGEAQSKISDLQSQLAGEKARRGE
jgi:hypothetical protein